MPRIKMSTRIGRFRDALGRVGWVVLVIVPMGCHRPADRSTPAPPARQPPKAAVPIQPLVFRAEELPFRYERGETGAAWPVETVGGGVGLLDFDGDGRLDLFFAQGGPLIPGKGPARSDALLRNLGGGRFEDVSARVGLIPNGYGQGVAVADYDGDGDPDVYVTRYGRNTLWRNDRGKFTDVTDHAGVAVGRWSLGAAFADYDGDGDLDLFVATYFTFDPAQAPFHRDPLTGAPEYGMPAEFPGQPDVLFRNEGDGRFTDVTAAAGVAGAGRGMGVVAADFDGDGRIDFLVANDAEPNALWRNRGDGTFEEVATGWGIAVDAQGRVAANMGIAHGDTDGDGLQDVVITHFYGEYDTLWRKEVLPNGQVLFEDRTQEAGLAVDSMPTTGWGIALADFDQDGSLDMMVTNGHIRRERPLLYNYENPPLLWRNGGEGRFANVTATGGDYFQAMHQGRGLACGDLDDDGDLDLVIVHHHAPSVILWNETPRRGHWLMVKLRGRPPNRDAIGARLTARIGSRTLVRTLDGGGSYISAGDPRAHFGLGQAARVDSLEVQWPSGRVETRSNLPVDSVVEWVEVD
ncbi:MAG TPA: CRTAC1 family protein [Isosphaeraceae bacterium]|nr:CRTAC1 family protein [Isosphaeraceae bacterium]